MSVLIRSASTLLIPTIHVYILFLYPTMIATKMVFVQYPQHMFCFYTSHTIATKNDSCSISWEGIIGLVHLHVYQMMLTEFLVGIITRHYSSIFNRVTLLAERQKKAFIHYHENQSVDLDTTLYIQLNIPFCRWNCYVWFVLQTAFVARV